MAAPNIVNVTTITGKSAGLAVTTTATDIVSNDSDTSNVIKVNALYVANVDGSAAAGITASVVKNRTPYHLAFTMTVPADSTVDILSKPIYLEEGDSIRLTASADGDLEAVCSYEVIS